MNFSEKLRKVVCGLLVLVLFSCESVVEIPVPKHTPKLALSVDVGNESPDSLFYVQFPFLRPYVGRSQGILSTGNLEGVENASLVITDNAGNLVETFVPQSRNDPYYLGPGYYRSSKKFAGQPGQQYILTASAPGFETVTGKLTLPNTVSGVQGTITRTALMPYGMDARVSLTFSDNGSENNYYLIYGHLLDGSRNPLPFRTFAESAGDNGITAEINEFHFSDRESLRYLPFDDKTFQGKSITISRPVSLYYGQQGNPARYLRLTVSNITPEKYRFLKTLELYYDTNDNPFSEPSAVRGNLTNGYGYFGGYINSYIDIPLPQ